MTSCRLFATAMILGCCHVAALADPANVTMERLLAAPNNGDDWLTYGRTYSEQRFSPLAEINVDTVEALHVDWFADIHSEDGLVSTPIVVDGIIYVSGAFARVFAIDGTTGNQIWTYDPVVDRAASLNTSWSVRINRGVAVWQGRVFIGTGDCRVIALDAATGEEIWSIVSCDSSAGAAITGAPRIVNGMLIIGHGGGDVGARGYASAYSVENGVLLWRFYTVPGTPDNGFEHPVLAKAAKTWHGDKRWQGTGGTVWNAITYDQDLNRIYIGTGGPYPAIASERDPEGGDNLFTESIIALDADTGEYIWHYQQVPHDTWDYNAATDMVLTEVPIEGQTRKVLMQAPKNGFFYVIDRLTGELLSAEKYTTVTWARGIDLESGRPIENAEARYYNNPDKKALVYPGVNGSHSWQPMSYSPDTGLVYLPTQDFPSIYVQDPAHGLVVPPLPESVEQHGYLIAWDPVSQSERWRIEHELAINGGTLSTAGNLVFQGTATGQLWAYVADSGKRLWSSALGSSMQAAPITYRAKGQQYVLAPVGLGGSARLIRPEQGAAPGATGPSRLIAFSLGQSHTSLPQVNPLPQLPEPPEQNASAAQLAHGKKLWTETGCYNCHGEEVKGLTGGSIPDLRYMSRETHREWHAVVLGGSRIKKGMLPFHESLTVEDSEAVHAYVIQRSREDFDFLLRHLRKGSLD